MELVKTRDGWQVVSWATGPAPTWHNKAADLLRLREEHLSEAARLEEQDAALSQMLLDLAEEAETSACWLIQQHRRRVA